MALDAWKNNLVLVEPHFERVRTKFPSLVHHSASALLSSIYAIGGKLTSGAMNAQVIVLATTPSTLKSRRRRWDNMFYTIFTRFLPHMAIDIENKV